MKELVCRDWVGIISFHARKHTEEIGRLEKSRGIDIDNRFSERYPLSFKFNDVIERLGGFQPR